MDYKKMWQVAEIPVYVMVVTSIVLLPLVAYGIINSLIQGIVGWAVTIGAFAYIGYLVKKNGGTTGEAAKYGAFAGVVVGFIGAIINIVSMYIFPQIFAKALEAAASTGAPMETMETVMKISIYFGLVFGPLVSALIGAAISAISGAVTKK